MDWLHAFWLAVLQGFTEFLPISSSAHLILLPVFAGWPDQGLTFDIAIHIGTLTAVVLYFRATVYSVSRDTLRSLAHRQAVGESRLGWAVVVGTVPVVITGLLFADLAEGVLRAPLVIAGTTIVFGVLLWVADRFAGGPRSEESVTLRDALIIGCAQAIAIIPGTSRSGITMTAALFLGMTPTASARFSFLLSIPVIALAGAWKAVALVRGGGTAQWEVMLFGAVLAAVTAYLCIGFFLALLKRLGMTPWVIYRMVLGAVLLVVFL